MKIFINVNDIDICLNLNEKEIDKSIYKSIDNSKDNTINSKDSSKDNSKDILKKSKDLELIDIIIGAKYINYFHYINIFECKKYLENRYNACYNKCCLIINYNTEKLKI